jgi:hypothetical protein
MGEADLSFEQIMELLKAKMSQPTGAYPTPYNVAASQMSPQQQQGLLSNASRPISMPQIAVPQMNTGMQAGGISRDDIRRLMNTDFMKNVMNLPNRISNSMWSNYAGPAAVMSQPMNIGFPSMVSGAMGMPR